MLKIQRSTIQLLRFPFSFFLMPVYWFALSQVQTVHAGKAIFIFIILHFFVYPASNGYNSYIDRDTTPIGGIKNPLQPEKQLLEITWVFNIIAVFLSFLISASFAIGILLYILASLAYSSRRVRLKRFPVIGFLTVILFQGALIFYLVYQGSSSTTNAIPVTGMAGAAFLIGGFYPLTQIYQHDADRKDGVTTISAMLGYTGTFLFTGIIYALAFLVLAYHFYSQGKIEFFILLLTFLLPVLFYFFYWFKKVQKDHSQADFYHAMKMNILASLCSNLGFITILILSHLE